MSKVRKNEEKSGFVYIWRDRKHNRYYVGCHWGYEDDGYICSSRWMRLSYNRRKEDFKRRIISRNIQSRQTLLDEEYKWLSMIKPNEIKIRYYNLQIQKFSHWSANKDLSESIGQRISAANKGRKSVFVDPEQRNRNISEAKKAAFVKKRELLGYVFTPEHIESIAAQNRGRVQSLEQRTQTSTRLRNEWATGIRKAGPKKPPGPPGRQRGERLVELWGNGSWKENQKSLLKSGSRRRWDSIPATDKHKASAAATGKKNAKKWKITGPDGVIYNVTNRNEFMKEHNIKFTNKKGRICNKYGWIAEVVL